MRLGLEVLREERKDVVRPMKNHLFQPDVGENYPDYLRDESRKSGRADSISFVASEDDIRAVLSSQRSVTTQGARTGITGGAVPNGGHILNLSRMSRVTGLRAASDGHAFYLTVQPGLTLLELRKCIQTREFDTEGWSQDSLESLDLFRRSVPFYFPPDPTETTASLGGMVACNASGACTYKYGATRNYIEALRIVLASGEVVSLRRGRDKAQGRVVSIPTQSGHVIQGIVPGYDMPAVKNASGFFARENEEGNCRGILCGWSVQKVATSK